MNRRDTQCIAKAMNAAHAGAFHRQTAATAWAYCIEQLAGALSECCPSFNREEFLATCRGGGAPSVGQDQEVA